ncbi:hypothetical protein Q5P01_014235 [Channa striata]|uniref:Uncharacterized protein n=1 Tax=Channa striata TaxID=64152 RepID=A0AA88SPD8_CHASR|nr:hypothetical protein Q5P01_014235 [Channa striata]
MEEPKQDVISALRQKEEELESYRNRSALRQKEEELKSFKDRMAADLTSSIETGDTENMSNTVSQTRLKKMYDKLKLQHWPKVKDCLKANNGSSQTARAVIQKWFQEAAKQMEKRKEQINEVFGLTQDNKEPTHQKVREYRQLTVQNLQLALYHSGREHNQISLPQYDGQYPQDVVDIFRSLVSECYQLGCLMALNHPPLIPDWQNHVPGMDSWDIFPQEITPVELI